MKNLIKVLYKHGIEHLETVPMEVPMPPSHSAKYHKCSRTATRGFKQAASQARRQAVWHKSNSMHKYKYGTYHSAWFHE